MFRLLDAPRRIVSAVAPATTHHGLGMRILAIAALAVLLAGLTFVLPTTVRDILRDLRQPLPHVYSLTPPNVPEQPTRSRLHLAVLNVDQWGGTVDIRVSGTHVCETPCPWNDQFLFVAEQRSQIGVEGLPAFATVTLPPTATEISQEITLPINGYPLRYPFDTYELGLGVIMQRVPANGVAVPLSAAKAQGHLFISLNSHVPALIMNPPIAVNPSSVDIPESAYEYTNLQILTFGRPSYQQALAALLVLLTAVTTVYSAFVRSVTDLVTGIGSFVLTLWGVRSIIVGFTTPGITGVDLALSGIILFLLVALALRLLHHLLAHVMLRLVPHRLRHDRSAGDGANDQAVAITAPKPQLTDRRQAPAPSDDGQSVPAENADAAAGRQLRVRNRGRVRHRYGARRDAPAQGSANA
ncbi:MAG: hypothetical protein ICV72_12260, partial [Aldersonia sp.]|nr:hypothetical protein [Aldersonia sp.]